LVWQEGRESNPDGYGYSRFCDLYRRWLKKLDLVLRQGRCQDFCVNGFRLVDGFRLHWLHLSGG
jgi:transposase